VSLGELVDFTASEACKELLGELVGDWLAFLTLVVFEELHALEGSGTSDELVRELDLVVRVVVTAILAVHLLMVLLSVIWVRNVSIGLAPARGTGWGR